MSEVGRARARAAAPPRSDSTGALRASTSASRSRQQAARARAELGQRGEQIACEYLTDRGFRIVARNVRVGRLELDVIAQRGALLVVCEVRARTSDRLMTPAQSIDARKVAHVRAATAQWLRSAKPSTTQLRFDVASIVFDAPQGRLTYLEGAF